MAQAGVGQALGQAGVQLVELDDAGLGRLELGLQRIQRAALRFDLALEHARDLGHLGFGGEAGALQVQRALALKCELLVEVGDPAGQGDVLRAGLLEALLQDGMLLLGEDAVLLQLRGHGLALAIAPLGLLGAGAQGGRLLLQIRDTVHRGLTRVFELDHLGSTLGAFDLQLLDLQIAAAQRGVDGGVAVTPCR